MKLLIKFFFAFLLIAALAVGVLYLSGELIVGIPQWETKEDYSYSGKKLNKVLSEKGIEVKDSRQIILLNFWEPYCGHCVLEIPDLNKLYKKCIPFHPEFYAICAVDSMDAERNLNKCSRNFMFKKLYSVKGLRFDLRTIHEGKEPKDDALPQTYLIKGGDSIIYFKLGRLEKKDLDSVYQLIQD